MFNRPGVKRLRDAKAEKRPLYTSHWTYKFIPNFISHLVQHTHCRSWIRRNRVTLVCIAQVWMCRFRWRMWHASDRISWVSPSESSSELKTRRSRWLIGSYSVGVIVMLSQELEKKLADETDRVMIHTLINDADWKVSDKKCLTWNWTISGSDCCGRHWVTCGHCFSSNLYGTSRIWRETFFNPKWSRCPCQWSLPKSQWPLPTGTLGSDAGQTFRLPTVCHSFVPMRQVLGHRQSHSRVSKNFCG